MWHVALGVVRNVFEGFMAGWGVDLVIADLLKHWLSTGHEMNVGRT